MIDAGDTSEMETMVLDGDNGSRGGYGGTLVTDVAADGEPRTGELIARLPGSIAGDLPLLEQPERGRTEQAALRATALVPIQIRPVLCW